LIEAQIPVCAGGEYRYKTTLGKIFMLLCGALKQTQ